MVRWVFLLLFIAVTLLVAWAMTEFVANVRRRRAASASGITKPKPEDSNAQWAEYYRRMALDARRTGDDVSAADYDSLARTYTELRSDP